MSEPQSAGSRKMSARKLLLASWWVSIALAVFLSLKPGLQLGINVGENWNVGHALAYTVLMLHPALLFSPRSRPWIALGLMSMGIAIEFIQPHFGRHFRYVDMAADGFGIVFGMWAGTMARPRLEKLLRL